MPPLPKRPYQLYHDDCFNVFPVLAPKAFDLILTDPPYGTTACKWDTVLPLEDMWYWIKSLLKPTGAVIFTASQPFTAVLTCSNLAWFKYELIWEKSSATGILDCKFRPLKAHENILVFSPVGCSNGSKPPMVYHPQMTPGKPYTIKRKGSIGLGGSRSQQQRLATHCPTGERYPRSVVYMSKANGPKYHDTQKPVPLMEYLIKTFTDPNALVLDFCMGSGTTGVACMNTARRFVGIEKDIEHGYFQTAEQRIKEAYEISKANRADT